ncbi:ATP-binding protein [Nocardia mangyaensis]|uniref:ATP-binding protein n=1 Tax=Nocardia mangyaensis TaxID=2213200 RepID=A0A1J0VPR1_9NOCA|nr:AAA family ATPase [Nocardia mangyaensis]APE33967.1 ATP-binding protein [Nocardia mangyaensis]
MELSAAIADFDRSRVADRVANAEQQRKRVLAEFPLEAWPALEVERYALGCGPGTYCRLMEFDTVDLGGIGGGSAGKHIIFRRSSGEWKLAPQLGSDLEAGWTRLRAQFVAAFDAVRREAFDELDDLDALRSGQSLVTKSLATYFPQHFLPVFSGSHLRSFIERLGGTPERGATSWRANRQLLALVEQFPEFSEWEPHELMQFLYDYFDPRERSRPIWKIAPGEQAKYWKDCLEGNYICVGWDELGDLSQYTSDTDLKDAFTALWPTSAISSAKNLLAYRDLEPGDRIIANQGMSTVLAIGTVTGGYRFDDSRTDCKHVVPVAWDTSHARRLDTPQGWRRTIVKVKDSLFAELTKAQSAQNPRAADVEPELPESISAITAALHRKGQAILYGPPGTGKTRLALNVALATHGRTADIDGPNRNAAVTELLETGRVRLVTFHPSYGYEDFVEGFKPAHHPGTAGLHLELTDGLFHKLCAEAATADEGDKFLLIIDEINRGDLPRIFGELITVLESDKRGLGVDLPISQRVFAVPPNVQIIGTMNTADRSVGHLDAAIRRRFAFVHVGPDPEVVSGTIGPLELPELLSALNDRIAGHLDADHQIGHAYLLHNGLPISTEEELAAAYYHDIVPLLEDYCMGRAELLHRVLGSLVDPETSRPKIITATDLPTSLATEFTTSTSGLDE